MDQRVSFFLFILLTCLTGVLTSCGFSSQPAITPKAISIQDDPDLSDTPLDGGLYSQAIIPVDGMRYGECRGIGEGPIQLPDGRFDCEFPRGGINSYQGNYQLVAYGPGWDAQKVAFRQMSNFWNFVQNVLYAFESVVYTNGCYGPQTNCRHYWGTNYTRVNIDTRVGQTVYFYLVPR